MRTINCTFLALTVVMTIAIITPRVDAGQSSPFVQFLVAKTCTGQSAPYRNGCNGYLHKRITQHKPPTQSLEEAQNLCNQWYSTNPSNKSQCIQGCQFLNSKE